MKKPNLLLLPALLCTLSLSAYGDSPVKPSVHEEEYEELMGRLWLADKGLMLTAVPEEGPETDFSQEKEIRGQKVEYYDTRRALDYELKKVCVMLKLQSEFDATDDKATPANFVWTKDAGSDAFWQVDAAVRLDFWIPGLYVKDKSEASIAIGYEMHRNDEAGSQKDLQSYHLSIPFVDKWLFGRIPFLETSDQVWQIGISYNTDRISGEEGFDVETDYKPVFKLGPKTGKGLWFGTRCGFDHEPIDPSKPIDRPVYSILPKGGISYGSKYKLGSPIVTPDDDLVGSYSITGELGRPIGEDKKLRLMLRAGFKGGVNLTGSGSFDKQWASLSLEGNGNKTPFSLALTYANGSDDFDSAEVDRFQATLGLQF